MAHSPWCDGPTLLPSVLCSLHPTRWVSKGSYRRFFTPKTQNRSASAAVPASPTPGLPTDLDATSAAGEAGGSSPDLQHPAGSQLRQPADDAGTPAAAELDAAVDRLEAGGAPGTAGSGLSVAPDQQQQQQQQGEPAAEQPPKTEKGPAEQQRAQSVRGQQSPADQGSTQQEQGAPAQQVPGEQPQQASRAQPPAAAASQLPSQQDHAAVDQGAQREQDQRQQQEPPASNAGAGRLPPVTEVNK